MIPNVGSLKTSLNKPRLSIELQPPEIWSQYSFLRCLNICVWGQRWGTKQGPLAGGSTLSYISVGGCMLNHMWHDNRLENPKCSEKNLSYCHFIHNKSNMDDPAIVSLPPQVESISTVLIRHYIEPVLGTTSLNNRRKHSLGLSAKAVLIDYCKMCFLSLCKRRVFVRIDIFN